MAQKPQSTRRIINTFLRPWWRRPLALLAGFALALVAGRIALEPWLTAKIRGNLARLDGAGAVTFRALDVSLFPPSVAFSDIILHGRSGESLEVDRLDVLPASWWELTAAAPHVRLKLQRPRLRTTPDARDLDLLARALPTAHVDIASVTNGSVTNSAGGDGRSVLGGLNATVEGLATGTAVGSGAWKITADGRLAELHPVHVVITSASAGRWDMALTARALAWAPSLDELPMTIAAGVQGTGSRLKALVHVSWSGSVLPVMLARDTVSGLSDKWPATDLVVTEARGDLTGGGQALDLVLVDDSRRSATDGFHPRDGISVVVNVVRLGTEVLIPSPAGLAAVVNENPTRARANLAVNLVNGP